MDFKEIGVVVFLSLLLSCNASQFNPYQVLEVPKTADNQQIRKAYKSLVKEWHPDKSDKPEAQDKFIQIQQAYEILSNDEKRRQYDVQGFSQDGNQQSGFNDAYRNYHSDFNFGDDIFNFDFSSEGSKHSVTEHELYNNIIPHSYTSPQVLYVYSTFCVQCIVILKSSWKTAVAELENLGIGVGTVDTTFSTRLAVALGVQRIPTVVVIHEEKYFYYRGLISYRNLKQFINSQLPSEFITGVGSHNLKTFLSQVNTHDKPRVLLFSAHEKPLLLYTLMSLKHHSYIDFGFVSLLSDDSKKLSQRFNVIGKGPSLLLFKEDIEKPVVTLQSSDMPRGAVDDLLTSNHFLTAPRLTSQSVFDQLCPIKEGRLSQTRFCALFCVARKSQVTTLRSLVASALADDEQLKKWLEFVYFNPGAQPELKKALIVGDVQCDENPQVSLLYRASNQQTLVTTGSAAFLNLPDGSEYGFQKLLALALRTKQQLQFEREVVLPKLRDELAPMALVRMLSQLKQIPAYVTKLSEPEFMMVFVTSVVCLLSLYSVVHKIIFPDAKNAAGNLPQDGDEEGSDEDIEVDVSFDDEETTEKPPTNELNCSGLDELTPVNYADLILRQSRGHIIVVLLNEGRRDEIVEEFVNVMKVYVMSPKLHVATLDSSKFLTWYKELRRSSSPLPPSDTAEEIEPNSDLSSLHSHSNTAQESSFDKTLDNVATHGTVLAMNGAKHWYCIFVPRECRTPDVTKQVIASNLASGDAPSPDSATQPSGQTEGATVIAAPYSESDYGNALMQWMDRVCEGQMPRLYVRQWPGLYVRRSSEV